MTLAAVVVVFLLMQSRKSVRFIQQDEWLFTWNTWLHDKLKDRLSSEIVTLAVIAGPCALVAILCLMLGDTLYGLPLLIALVVTLVYSLGRGDFIGLITDYLASWRVGDFQSAYRIASQFSHGELLQQTDDISSLHRHAVQAMLYQSFERWFAVIFWLVLAGPFGALLYRLSFLLANQHGAPNSSCHSTICRVIYWLEWIPVRLWGISVSVVGNFVSSAVYWKNCLGHDDVATEQRLMDYGLAALGEDVALACQNCESEDQEAVIVQGAKQIESLRALVDRTVLFSVVVAAFLLIYKG